jgi:hypothetical protein
MEKNKLKKIVDLANKSVSKTKPKKGKKKDEIEEGILDNTFSIPSKKGQPSGHDEIYVVNTSDFIDDQSSNPYLRTTFLAPPALSLGVIAEDSILSKDGEYDGDLIDDTHFENDDLVSSIENIVKLIPEEPKKLKAIFNLFSELIKNLSIEELPEEVRHKLCKKIMNKNSRLINNF